MPRFHYKAYDATGAMKTGELTVDTRAAALEALARRAEVAVELLESNAAAATPWWQREITLSRELSAPALANFTRELSSLVNANLPLDEALRLIALQPALKSRVRTITRNVLERVTEGQSLSSSLAAQNGAFPDFACRLIEAGEASGSLGAVLDDLAKYLERSTELRAKTVSQLLYPGVLLLAAMAALIVITTVLIPAIRPIFEDAQTAPPALVRLLSGLETFLRENVLVLSAAFLAAIAAVALALKSAPLRRQIDSAVLKLPMIGPLIAQSQTARLSRTLAALLRNNVPVTDAVRISGGVLNNQAFAGALHDALTEIEQGSTLSAPLTRSGLFPELFLRLTRVGEETGQLDAMLLRSAESYDSAVARRVERLLTLLTPVLTLLIGGFVGALIISVMNAILSVNELVFQ